MNEALVQHQRHLITRYHQSLQALERQQAEQGIDLGRVNQIDNLKQLILGLEQALTQWAAPAPGASGGQLLPVPFPLQKYETLISCLAETLSEWEPTATEYPPHVFASLKRAFGAKYVFLAQVVEGTWQMQPDPATPLTEITQLLTPASAFRELVLQAAAQPGLTLGILGEAATRCLFLPVGVGGAPAILVGYGLPSNLEYDKGLELILATLVRHTHSFSVPVAADQLEMLIYNALKRQFGHVSEAMYNRQFYLFNQKLDSMTIYFEPIIFLSPTAPSIFGWEALAREPQTAQAPAELLATAELWGPRFQLQLDMYFLKRAIGLYVTDDSHPNGAQIRRKHTLLALSVNVHPATLLRTRYYDTLRKIQEQGYLPLNKLYLEISEKAPLPVGEDWDGLQNPAEAFREALYKYRDLEVHFAVDDFGVGFASSSRVSRLGPAFVKIDRDALLDDFGNFTMEYVIRLARRMPGEMRVIVEGYDADSKFPLRRLYELGVRYIQGHKYGSPRAQVDDRLPAQVAREISQALAGL